MYDTYVIIIIIIVFHWHAVDWSCDITLQCQREVDDVIGHSSTSRVLLKSRGFLLLTGQETASCSNNF